MAEKDVLVYKFEELENCSDKMKSVCDALENVKKIFQETKNRVNNYWNGNAANAFLIRFDNVNSAVDSLLKQVSSSKDKLDRAIILETENEENVKNNIVGILSADDIF